MKPIGGIVTSKKSIPENFRQVENFTTEYLSKLWKIYTINRDVLDKGRRLENLFWRIWGSERIKRTFSGEMVSKIFMKIVEGEERTEYGIPPRQITAPPPHPIENLTTPRPSLEIECPPTPPPSPVPPVTSVVGFQLGSSYLSKFPSQTAITASLQQAFPDAPPSPPCPYARPSTTPTIPEEEVEVPDAPPPKLPQLPQPPQPTIPNHTTKAATKEKISYCKIASEEEDSNSSKEGRKKDKARKAKTERPPRGRRKIVATTKATTARTTAARKIRPGATRRKSSSSSSNTAVNTAVSSPSNTLTVDVAQSLPSASQKQQQRNSSGSGGSESERALKKGDVSCGWVVDPDFRTKYLERKRREKLGALTSIMPVVATKTSPTTTVVQSVATTSTRIGRGKGKNVLVVDEMVPLKELAEDVQGPQVAKIKMIGSVLEEEIDELPSNLVRRKSELTLLFEGAKKAGGKGGKVQAISEEKTR